MIRQLLLFCLTVACVQLSAQNSLQQIGQIQEQGRWVQIEQDIEMPAKTFLDTYQAELGLDEAVDFQPIEIESDKLGMTHSRFQQFMNGIPVDGAHYIVHQEGERVKSVNGRPVSGIYMPAQALISSEEAIEAALLYVDADHYYWEDAHKEQMLKRVRRDVNATFYPSPELVYADRTYSQDGSNYRLAWKMDVYASGQRGQKTVYIDAKDGHILYTIDQCVHVSVEGQAETRYHGLRTLMTDSVGPNQYRLRDYSRLASIETFDLNQLDPDTIPEGAVDFTDEDNYWDNANSEFNDAATDVHWGMQQTYDYFYNTHNRVSFDGDTAPIVSYVHVRQNWFNARWTGAWAEFGDGNNNPLTSIDVVSHELTHGVTRNSANLVYMNEPGALNESFSDIFGSAVEYYALRDSADWLVGLDNFQLRSMADPKSEGDPDTYQGQNWEFGDFDNGGVHINSGVQNYWFYLLVEGGSGVNDNGDEYEVEPIGWEAAEAIAYRNLAVYLTVTSQYVDARYGAILAAEDLYGPCSEEVLQVISAWHAVGVGPDMVVSDMEVLEPQSLDKSSCDFGTEEFISIDVLFRRSGCQDGIPAGTAIPIGYTLNNGAPVVDTLYLQDTLREGESFTYTFQTPVDLSASAYYDFDFFATFDGDQNPFNDILPTFTIASVQTLDESYMIHFNEFTRPAQPPYFLEAGDHAQVGVARDAASTGLRGLQMTGLNVQQNNIDFATNQEENFTKNPDYESRICMCVDATGYDSVSVEFDMRQHVSDLYEAIGNPVAYQGIAMQIFADGEPVSPQYNPDTVRNDTIDIDTFVHHLVNMDQLAGTSFNICFRGKHFIGPVDDFTNSGGDYTHLDNINFILKTRESGTNSPRLNENLISVYPNPATTQLFLEANETSSFSDWKIFDLSGRMIQQGQWNNQNQLEVNVSNINSGIYMLECMSVEGRVLKKVIIE